MRNVIAAAACGLILGGCASGGPKAAAPATDAQRTLLLDRVKTLEGAWESVDDKGQAHVATTFKVSSAGSVVREVMLPGTDEEMTNIYHMDGPTLIMTHYCAMGNQPRMRASAGDGKVIALKFDSVTNLASSGQEYMGDMTLTIKDRDHITEEWTSYQGGQAKPHARFEMSRKK